MSESKPIKAKARTKAFAHARRMPDDKIDHDLTVGVITSTKHETSTQRGWAYLNLARAGNEFSADLPLAQLEKLHEAIGKAIEQLRAPAALCTRADCYDCKRGRWAP